ncbi:hypothetical protein GCM10020367_40200 [Streptomyces sannanensis]|uniref:DUF4034 domain-containing protein n=1 Tax=Streptomyces sannanensis TaxID=285536 RepID=A0ABP6SF71_9ACTN
MTILLWVVLTPIALAVLAIGLYFLKAILEGVREGAREGWREGTEESLRYKLPDEAAALGFVPRDQQDTENAAPLPALLTGAMAAARAGDWKPAAALFEEAGRDWERRSAYSERLSGIAAEDDTWLLAWESALPDDPTAALLRARSTVHLAGKIRGSRRAQYTTSEQFEGFHRTLVRSREENARAAALAPEDPDPYISEIQIALGLGYPHADMDRIWDEITARAPHHYAAHFYALQYWCAKWRGSEKLAREFAARAADRAPLGSLMKAFPLIAHFEHDDSGSTEADRTPEMHALVDAALADAAAADPDHPRLSEVRHLLAYYLCLQGRDQAAVEQFRLVDGHIGALPWRYRANPAETYCKLRDASVSAAAEAD